MMLNNKQFSMYKFNARYTDSQCVRLFSPENMQLGYSCRALMQSYEKLFKLPYWDQDGKLLTEYKKGATIGYGHLITSPGEFEKYRNGITEAQAEILFNDNLYEPIHAVRYHIKEKLTQNEFDGLVMFAFNIGVNAFKKSTVLKIINGEISANLKNAWRSFKYSQGRINHGLINRRDAEMNVFFNGIYFKK